MDDLFCTVSKLFNKKTHFNFFVIAQTVNANIQVLLIKKYRGKSPDNFKVGERCLFLIFVSSKTKIFLIKFTVKNFVTLTISMPHSIFMWFFIGMLLFIPEKCIFLCIPQSITDFSCPIKTYQ